MQSTLLLQFFSTELQQQQQQEEGSVDSGIDGYELNDIREIISKSVDVVGLSPATGNK